jgi:hypothetical protein
MKDTAYAVKKLAIYTAVTEGTADAGTVETAVTEESA